MSSSPPPQKKTISVGKPNRKNAGEGANGRVCVPVHNCAPELLNSRTQSPPTLTFDPGAQHVPCL
uniref:Uncharacterized protein n=1 Tax=Anguilla anguilla TaxID=7936 RepID=A0A0E9U045_ANGAN